MENDFPERDTRMVEEFSARCRRAGMKLTPQRLEIFREILESRDHPTVDEIFERVRRRLPSLSRDTVYRTLWMLRDMSLIGTVGYPYRSVHFDGNSRRHDHFLCTRCGGIVDLEDPVEIRAPETVGQLGKIESTYVEYRGLCSRCLSEQAEHDPDESGG